MCCSEAPPQPGGPRSVPASSSPSHRATRHTRETMARGVRAASGHPFLLLWAVREAPANAHSPRSCPGLPHAPHRQHHTPPKATAFPTCRARRPLHAELPHLGYDVDTGASQPRSSPGSLGHRTRCPGLEPPPAKPGGRNSQMHCPPLTWAQAGASPLSLATGRGWGTQERH